MKFDLSHDAIANGSSRIIGRLYRRGPELSNPVVVINCEVIAEAPNYTKQLCLSI